jgi:two-component sensor histidine kinase
MSHDILPVAQYGPEVEREAGAAARSVGAALSVGGALGLAMTFQEPGLGRGERLAAGVASGATIVAGSIMAVTPALLLVPARRQGQGFAVGCHVAAITSTALGGGHRSPAFFPAVLLTALGAGVAGDAKGGLGAGAATAVGYLAGCARTLAPWQQPLTRDAWWNLTGACAFVAGGQVGGTAGELSLLARALSDYVARESEAERAGGGRAQIEADAATVRRAAEHFLELLPEIEREFESDPTVREATGALATALASLSSAELRLSAAATQLELDLLPQLERLAANFNTRQGDVQVRLRAPRNTPRASAASVAVVINCATALIQNAANARAGRDVAVTVDISIELKYEAGRRWLVLSFEDDAGGGEVPRDRWGIGLSDAERSAARIGGTFRPEVGRRGLRAVLDLPYVQGRALGSESLTLAGQFADGRDRAIRVLQWASAAQGLFTLLSVTPRNRLRRSLALLGAFIAAGERAERFPDRRRAPAHAALAAAGMTAFAGPGRPPLAGWASVMCAAPAARQHWIWGTLGAATATAGAIAVAGPERFASALPTTIGDRTFALIGAAGGAGVAWGLRRLAREEERVAHEAWLRGLLEDVVAPGRDDHHFLAPLRHALGDERWSTFRRTPLGKRLESIQGTELLEAQQRLEEHLRSGDPLRALQHQVARLLAPAPVRVRGERPHPTDPGEGRELEAVAYRVGLISVGQAIARRVRAHLPTRLLGREQLQELQLSLSPNGRLTQVDALPVPFRADRGDRVDAILNAAAQRAGGYAGTELADRFTTFVDSSALT